MQTQQARRPPRPDRDGGGHPRRDLRERRPPATASSSSPRETPPFTRGRDSSIVPSSTSALVSWRSLGGVRDRAPPSAGSSMLPARSRHRLSTSRRSKPADAGQQKARSCFHPSDAHSLPPSAREIQLV